MCLTLEEVAQQKHNAFPTTVWDGFAGRHPVGVDELEGTALALGGLAMK